MTKKSKWFYVRLLAIWLIICLLFLVLFKRIDYSPLESHRFYQKNKLKLASFQPLQKKYGFVKAGWSSANITPNFPCPSAGFGNRGNFDTIMDSIFVRSVMFEVKEQKYLYLSFDLLIIHPDLVKAIEQKIKENNLKFSHIFYTATHSHNSIGGYGKGLASRLALGAYNQSVTDLIVNQTLKSIQKSMSKLQAVDIAVSYIPTVGLVKNRVMEQSGKVDSSLNVIYLRNRDGKLAVLSSFGAHATSFLREMKSVSSDFPGSLVQKLEQEVGVDFGLFAAGGVASHGSTLLFPGKLAVDKYTDSLLSLIKNDMKGLHFEPLSQIRAFDYQMVTPITSMKINISGWALRDWVFRTFVGQPVPKLSFLQLNKTIIFGAPCDFSGELGLMLQSKMKKNNLIINSFNGQYLGYIIKDEYYTQDMHEARDQGWMGAYSGRYFTESILSVLMKMEKN